MKTANKEHQCPTPLGFLVVITVVIFSAQAAIILLFAIIAPLSPVAEGLIEALVIALILMPTLYIYMYCPMAVTISRQEKSKLESGYLKDEFRLLIDSTNFPIFVTNTAGTVS
jgi:hypothetical protein